MIEAAWHSLGSGSPTSLQTRIDALHPHDLYADVEPPGRVGLVVVTGSRPPRLAPMRAILVEERQRSDGRWALRLLLCEPPLRPVFAALCQDIIDSTRSGVGGGDLADAVVRRVLHWRGLLEGGGGGLDAAVLRGIIGELTVLQARLLPTLLPEDAIRCWTGPHGTPQDFQLPSGMRLEVKAVMRTADQVRINGLDQLDAGGDALVLVVVRLESTGPSAPGAVTPAALVSSLRRCLAGEPAALALLQAGLASLGWHDHPAHDLPIVRVTAMEDYNIDSSFPRLTRSTVPDGITAADYVVALPRPAPAPGAAP